MQELADLARAIARFGDGMRIRHALLPIFRHLSETRRTGAGFIRSAI
jgi:hypothetical protein